MATVAVQNPVDVKPAKPSSSSSNHFANWVIPEVIEERRKRSDGKIVCNRYVTGKLLGKGGFAKVFIGTLLPSKHEYALKIVSKASLTKDRARLKLQSEIKIHKSLDHENICRFERCFEDNNYYYLIMELCTNQSMSSLLEQRKRITEPEMRYYLRQLVLSLQYLREHLVIHRDLKLGNLFLDGQMRVKVGDFGLAAKLAYDTERKKTVCGTPNYIAPEILKSDTGHSFEVDIWSTGVIIYTLLVGRPPFQCKDVKSTYDRILSNTFAFPDHVMISAEAKNLITRMLQHYPSNRLRLSEVLEHSFFTASHNFTPSSLPESSLRQCPHIEDLTPRTTFNKLSPAHEDKRFDAYKVAPHSVTGDENDPNAINRLARAPAPAAVHKADPGTADAATAGVTTRSAASRMKATEAAKPIVSVLSQQSAAASQRPKSAGPLQRRTFQQKFDIFVDQEAKPSARAAASNPFAAVTGTAPISSSGGHSGHEVTPPAKMPSQSSPNCTRDDDSKRRQSQEFAELKSRAYRVLKPDSTDLQQVQTGLQQVQISEPAAPARRPREAWSAASTAMDAVTEDLPTTVNSACARVGTPPEQVLRTKDVEKLRPNTLEAVHDMLHGMDVQPEDPKHRHFGNSSCTSSKTCSKPDKFVPKIWVVRYVDYTSKYGLGFLLNNGSAGVNFNDSTKIVLSTDGRVFQYFERKRSGSASEHHSQRHFIDNYPAELHKKVTLLRHFRNYLFEEEKNSKKDTASASNQRDEAEQQAALRQAFSRDAFADAKATMEVEGIHQLRSLDEEPEMPFVKKYIRTKHAILFRLSNHTVQMVFYDRSEILLSSEARYITYVNKQGARSDHYLEDSSLAERTDISQRLKYTKDIMYRLITMPDPRSKPAGEC